MTLHLRKLAVGVRDVTDFERSVRRRMHGLERRGEPLVLRHLTRHAPTRAGELLDGGSLYWIVDGLMIVRTRLLALERVNGPNGKRCALVLEPKLVRTEPRPHRPFQGWRYLNASEAPPDIDRPSNDDLPPILADELRSLGLI